MAAVAARDTAKAETLMLHRLADIAQSLRLEGSLTEADPRGRPALCRSVAGQIDY